MFFCNQREACTRLPTPRPRHNFRSALDIVKEPICGRYWFPYKRKLHANSASISPKHRAGPPGVNRVVHGAMAPGQIA